jgi:integrative and conjugative element protein (TIGR02256 family)
MIHWFKKHPQFFLDETKRLATDPYYKEKFQARGNLLVSHGKIIIRKDAIHKFYFLIVYTNASPYALPLIFVLKHELDDQKVKFLSELDLGELGQSIANDVKIYYELRHQNANGMLCILEWDNLDTGVEFFSITSILNRLHQWCLGTITGEFPMDNLETELFAHFKNRNEHTKIFYDENFLIEEFNEGDCYSIRTNDYGSDFKAYFGTVLGGFLKEGVYDINLPILPLHPLLKTKEDYFKKPEFINDLITRDEILLAFWFHISKEITLFQTFNELISIIGNDSYENGLLRLATICFKQLKSMPKQFHIGIRYPNRKGELEFQLFKITKNHEVGQVIIGSDLERMRSIVPAYEYVEAIESEKLTREGFFMRNSTRASHLLLKNKAVNFFGLGSIGSELADTISKSGIGTARLIDNQCHAAHNAVRHVLGFNYVGAAKANAMAQYIRQHNPYLNVISNPVNVLIRDINDLAEQNSLSVSSIADDNIEAFLNEQAVISQKDFFYIRALRGGKVGRIFRVIPGRDGCFNCIQLHRIDNREFINVPEDLSMPTLKNECNNPIRPASAADLKLISSIASQIIIDHLQHGPSETNHWLWSTEDIGPLKRNQLNEQFIPIHPNCQYCNHERKFKVHIENETLEMMRDLIKEDNTIETGGVLVGVVNKEDGVIILKAASGPGPNSKRTSTRLEKDIQYCQTFLDDEFQKHGENSLYVGEWHSHPCEDNSPSSTDIRSLTEISYQKEYVTDMPLMVIFSETGVPSATIHPAGKTFYHCDIAIL